MAFSPKEIAVRAIVPRRDTRPARNIDEWIMDELALAEAYELALLEHRRKSLAVTPSEVVQAENKLCGALASGFERELNRTLRRVLQS
jgi:hypothetical protein